VIVLDASALLALLFREPGHDQVAAVLGSACLSAVNLSEVLLRFVRDGHDPRDVLGRLESTPIEHVPFLPNDAALAAALEPATRRWGLSFADRACLTLALTRGAPAITADGARAALDLPIEVRLIR